MRILYAIQGTGNGHLSRAGNIIPILQQHGTVDILISGKQADIELDYPVKYRFHGLGFIFGKNGGVDVLATYRKNHLKKLWNEIKSLPIEDYDVVINDFEPVSAWACYLKNKPCVSLSHQAAVLNKKAPRPEKKDKVGAAVLKYYAPTTMQYGFHFDQYDKGISTPVIRDQIRNLKTTEGKHYTVYLPAYSDKRIIKMLSRFKDIKWEVFSKHNKKPFKDENITIQHVSNEAFVWSMAGAAGVLCGAGFETPAETLFLKKKLMVIPMKGQYEQQCNAAALATLGVPVIKSLKEKYADQIAEWLYNEKVIWVDYPDRTAEVISTLFHNYPATTKRADIGTLIPSAKRFKNFIIAKILARLTG